MGSHRIQLVGMLTWVLLAAGRSLASQADAAGEPPVELPVPHVRQTHPLTCLVACGAMVLNFHGDPLGHDELWRSVRMWTDGTSALEVATAIRARGHDALTCAVRNDELGLLLRRGLPVVVMVARGGKHSIVVAGHDPARDAYFILDPAGSREWVDSATLFDLRRPYGFQSLLVVPSGMETVRAEWRAQDRRYRSDELLRVAE